MLSVLVLTFASLVPGGPIETRDFSHLAPQVFWGFNAILTALVGVSIVAAALAWRQSRLGLWIALCAAWTFVFVVGLDLGRIFPLSPDPISLPLGLIELLDGGLAAYAIVFSHKALGHI